MINTILFDIPYVIYPRMGYLRKINLNTCINKIKSKPPSIILKTNYKRYNSLKLNNRSLNKQIMSTC